MARRKRLSPMDPATAPALETKSAFSGLHDDAQSARPPIAHVAGDAAASAALAALSDEMSSARATGRMILEVPLASIDMGYLVRDRLSVDEEDMQSLVASIAARGQQTPIELADLGGGKFGLISGWRRIQALTRLSEQGDPRPALALLRSPDDAAEAYLAMVEENEIRVGLSYYERAHIVAVAVKQGVFSSEKEALQKIYHSASRAKRSKIGSFLAIVRGLGGALRFPTALGERGGLALAKALGERRGFAESLRSALEKTPPQTAEEEAELIRDMLSGAAPKPRPAVQKPQASPRAMPEGLLADAQPNGALLVSGPAFTPAMREKLLVWLSKQ
ncbi:MAG: ParB/RepB/Spo0J family partition protein [Sulfitobacter sp.]